MLNRLLLTISVLSLLLAGLALPARAEPSVATYYKTLSAYDFSPNNSALQFQGYVNLIYATQTHLGSAFSAQLNLPQEAQIVSVSYYLVDNTDHTTDINCSLRIYTPSTNSSASAASATTGALAPSPSVQAVTSTSGLPVTVDNSLKSYMFRIELTTIGNNQGIVGVQIAYTLPVPAPTGSQYLTAGAWAFRPVTSNMQYSELGGEVYITTNVPTMHMVDHLNLPVGTQLTGLVFYVEDNAAASNLTVGLDKTQLDSTGLSVNSATTSGASAGVQALAVSLGTSVTVQAGYSYSLYFRIAGSDPVSSQLHVAGARLTYTLPAAPHTPPYYTASLSGINFRPSATLIGYAGMGGGQFQTASLGSYGLFAPLELPQGAVLRRITCYVKDNDAANNISCSLKAYQPSTNSSFYLAEVTSVGLPLSDVTRTLSAQIAPTGAANPVNNSLYQYLVRVNYGSAATLNLMVYGVVVDYGWPIYVPVVKK